ncbi:MAG: hypothetical protein FGM24_01875 [Candidatus Kapabacteria bacterium]|nr:hypothetical protein [Candidatus Kapabacteria bacterium]
MKNIVRIALAVMLCTGSALAQRLPKDVPMPPINAGPGRTVEVKSVVKHYNFWGLKREVPLPWDQIVMKKSAIPQGVKLVSTTMSPSPALTKLIASPSIMLGGIESPAKKEVQHFKGTNAADNGTIVYMHWNKKLPADMRERLAKIFYSKNVRPDGPQLVEFIVNDNTLIIWGFTKHESAVKQGHQEEIFNVVSDLANKMFPPTDAKTPPGR